MFIYIEMEREGRKPLRASRRSMQDQGNWYWRDCVLLSNIT